MHPPLYTQGERMRIALAVSQATQTDASHGVELLDEPTNTIRENVDRTRQEDAQDADINYILSRFGVGAPQRPIQYGRVDYDMDLATAYSVLHEAELAHSRLTRTMRERYPTVQDMLNGIAKGDLIEDLKIEREAAEEAAAKPPIPPEPPPADR